jgi:hypothetical protein
VGEREAVVSYPATERQLEYVEALTLRLHLSADWFAGYCIATYGSEPTAMDVRTCSALLEEMQGWADHPDRLLRAQGQQDMFGGAL